MAVTHSGRTGLGVPSHVDQELSVALVHAPVPHQQTVDETVVDWDKLQDGKDVTHTTAQFMAVTRSGLTGLGVPSHVDRELNVALVHVPIPHQQTVDDVVVDWDKLQNRKDVTHKVAQPLREEPSV